ncbi:MAG TPA: hypothetical protein VIF02_08145 [Methylocella sp.]|jgi:hypothetical protein
MDSYDPHVIIKLGYATTLAEGRPSMSIWDNPELVGSKMRGRKKSARPLVAAAALFTAAITLAPQVSFADEDGVNHPLAKW